MDEEENEKNNVNTSVMKTNKYIARLAGMYYLLMAIFGAFGMMYVPSQINVEGNTFATLQNIVNEHMLFRFGIVSKLLCQTAFVFLAVELYRLFKGVNKKLSLLLLCFVIVSVPIAMFNELNQIAILQLLGDHSYLSGFNTAQLNSLALFFIDLHEKGIALVELFWGLWLFPFGLLIYKSGFIPKVIGLLLLVGCLSYVIEWFTQLLIPGGMAWVNNFITYASIGEFSTMLYLAIIGVKKSKVELLND